LNKLPYISTVLFVCLSPTQILNAQIILRKFRYTCQSAEPISSVHFINPPINPCSSYTSYSGSATLLLLQIIDMRQKKNRGTPSSGMLRRVALIRTDVSEGTYLLHHQGEKNRRARKNVRSNWQPKNAAKKYYEKRCILFLRSILRLLVTANVVPGSPILVTLMME
jgi:hypothetical protein